MNSCHSCGLPEWALSRPGVETQIIHRAKSTYGKKRDTKRTVWTCSQSCALQSRAVAELGPVTHKWKMSLREFAALESGQKITRTGGRPKKANKLTNAEKQRAYRERQKQGLSVTKTPSQVADSTTLANANSGVTLG